MTRKKVLPIVLATLIIFSTMVYMVSKALPDFMYSDYKYSVNADKSITIEKYTGNSEKPDIPRRIFGKKVQTIGEYAFAYCSELTSISIPKGRNLS